MPEYIRQPLLNKKQEQQLKEDMTPLWLDGLKGREIARRLQLGVKGTPYAKVRPDYIYFYRQRFELPIRRKPAFAKNTPYAKKHKVRRRRYKHRPKKLGLLPATDFIEEINKIINSIWHNRLKSYLLLHYWTPLRASEIYERTIDDFEIKKDRVIIHLLRKKKKHDLDDKDEDEPITVRRKLKEMESVVDYLQSGDWKNIRGTSETQKTHPFNFGRTTALNYVKMIFPKRYPHFFRFNFLTEEADQPGVTLRDLTIKACISISAASKYVFPDEKAEEKLDKAKLDRLKDEGVI